MDACCWVLCNLHLKDVFLLFEKFFLQQYSGYLCIREPTSHLFYFTIALLPRKINLTTKFEVTFAFYTEEKVPFAMREIHYHELQFLLGFMAWGSKMSCQPQCEGTDKMAESREMIADKKQGVRSLQFGWKVHELGKGATLNHYLIMSKIKIITCIIEYSADVSPRTSMSNSWIICAITFFTVFSFKN